MSIQYATNEDPDFVTLSESARPINVISNGWTPIFSNVERTILGVTDVVQKVVNWIGGFGDKPSINVYLGPLGLVNNINDASIISASGWTPIFGLVDRINIDGSVDVVQKVVNWIGDYGVKPAIDVYVGVAGFTIDILLAKSIKGFDAWYPVFATESDVERRLIKIIDWINGKGTKPPINVYLSDTGYVVDKFNAKDFRGSQGLDEQDIIDLVYSRVNVGNVKLSDSPIVGVDTYQFSDAGVATNFGGITITTQDLLDGIVQIRREIDNSWTKVIIPLNLTTYVSNSSFEEKIKQIPIVDNLGVLLNTISVLNNGGSSAHNAVDDVYEITSPYQGTGVILGNFNVDNIEFYSEIEVRLKSGSESVWYFGWENDTEGVSFVPTATWKKITGKFKRVTSTIYPILIGAGASNVGGGVIQIRNFKIKQADYVETQLSDRISIIEGVAVLDKPFDLAYELSIKDKVFIPVGEHVINTLITVPSGKEIYGVRGKSILKAGLLLNQVLLVYNATDVTLRDFTIKGISADTIMGGPHNAPAAGTIDTVTEAIGKNNIGTKTGIGLYNSERINISGVRVCNFDAYGLLNILSGKTYEYGVKLTDNYFNDNYIGLEMQGEAEYSSYVGNSFTRNQIGCVVDAGNNLFSNNHFDKNRVGVILSNGVNNSHGTFSACTFNHNSLYGFISNLITAGESINGCQFWYGDIYLLNTKGFNINGGQFGGTNVYIEGSGGGQNQISGVCFLTSNVYKDHNGSVSNTKLINNFYMNGGDASIINY